MMMNTLSSVACIHIEPEIPEHLCKTSTNGFGPGGAGGIIAGITVQLHITCMNVDGREQGQNKFDIASEEWLNRDSSTT